MLVADSVSFGYETSHEQVFVDLSMVLRRGEVVGLSGPSGAGKSTLGRLLAGYLYPQSGNVSLDGKPLSRTGVRPVQMLFQSPELAVNPRWLIRDILTEFQEPNWELWHRFGIQDGWLDRYPHELSGGELQRVATARTLGPQVQFLIADEISGMLDPVTQAEIWRALLDVVAERQIGTLVISHDGHLLARVSSRVLHLQAEGRIVVPS